MSDKILRQKLVRLAHANPGKIRDALLPLLSKQAAPQRYDVDGEALTLGKMMAKGISKKIWFNGNSKKPTFDIVISNTPSDEGSDAARWTGHSVPRARWEKSKLKDTTPKQAKVRYHAWVIGGLLKGMQFNTKVDYNMWAKEKSRTEEQKIKWLQSH